VSKTTTLARGHVTQADEFAVELIEPADAPAVIMLRWPPQASVTDPHKLAATANRIMEVLAAAVAKLATLGDGERWP
jgi:hypothetical protein